MLSNSFLMRYPLVSGFNVILLLLLRCTHSPFLARDGCSVTGSARSLRKPRVAYFLGGVWTHPEAFFTAVIDQDAWTMMDQNLQG